MIGACIALSLLAFVLSILAIASPLAALRGSAGSVYALAGGITGVALAIVLLAQGTYLNRRAVRRIIGNERTWDLLTAVLLVVTLAVSISAAAVAL